VSQQQYLGKRERERERERVMKNSHDNDMDPTLYGTIINFRGS
jgi:hypothetical protein